MLNTDRETDLNYRNWTEEEIDVHTTSKGYESVVEVVEYPSSKSLMVEIFHKLHKTVKNSEKSQIIIF